MSVVNHEIEPSLVEKGYIGGQRPLKRMRPLINVGSVNHQILSNQDTTVLFPDRSELAGHLLMSFQGPPLDDRLNQKVSSPIS